MSASTTSKQLGSSLIAEVLARRGDPGSAGWCASVRRAITPATEVAAYGYTERHLLDLTGWQAKVGARRAAAICASAPDVPCAKGSLGANLAQLQRRATEGSVDSKVNILPMLDIESAAGLLAGLVRQCAQHAIAVNFYALADTLARWGEGLSPASQHVRQRIVADYYSAPIAD